MDESGPQLTPEEILLERHRKEKKELNAKITNLRHSITKGDKKKKKEINAEIDSLEASLKSRHEQEIKHLKLNDLTNGVSNVHIDDNRNDLDSNSNTTEELFPKGIKYNEVKISKAQRKRDAKAIKEKERQERIANGMMNDCDNPRIIEQGKFKTILNDRQLVLHEIASDGDCMYKAIEHQLSLRAIQTSIEELRHKTSDYMRTHRDDFLPFMTSNKTGDLMNEEEYEQYCYEIENTKSWGGQLELRALSHLFKIPIEVIQAEGSNVLIGDFEYKSDKALMLSYHRHAYQLGEHYNSVTTIT